MLSWSFTRSAKDVPFEAISAFLNLYKRQRGMVKHISLLLSTAACQGFVRFPIRSFPSANSVSVL
ncbi:hypothetical protein PoMZ_02321, partial [Pyricularia oryzae]